MSPPPSPCKIRSARRGDAEGISDLLKACGAGTDSTTVTWIVSHPEMEMWVAVDAVDKVRGVITLSHRPRLSAAGRGAVIEEIMVLPSLRGQGIGTALMNTAVARAKVLSVRAIDAHTLHAADHQGAQFLARSGFSDTGGSVFRLDPSAPQK